LLLFYGSELQLIYLLGTILFTGLIYLLNYKKVSFGFWQIICGIALWYCMFNSGIHATVAGVIFAFLVPTNLLKILETKLHTPVYFIIIPIFALANTAIPLPEGSLAALNTQLSWGIKLGLCLGKPLGITAFCYYLVKRKWAELPDGVNLYRLIGAGILAGIGFTMSIFISTLAFGDVPTQNSAKISVLVASISAIIIGYCWFRFEKSPNKMLRPILLFSFLFRHEIGFDKSIEFSIHNGPYISYFIVGSVILDHFIRMKNIGSYLTTPFNFFLPACVALAAS